MQPKVLKITWFSGFFFTYIFLPRIKITENLANEITFISNDFEYFKKNLLVEILFCILLCYILYYIIYFYSKENISKT